MLPSFTQSFRSRQGNRISISGDFTDVSQEYDRLSRYFAVEFASPRSLVWRL